MKTLNFPDKAKPKFVRWILESLPKSMISFKYRTIGIYITVALNTAIADRMFN